MDGCTSLLSYTSLISDFQVLQCTIKERGCGKLRHAPLHNHVLCYVHCTYILYSAIVGKGFDEFC